MSSSRRETLRIVVQQLPSDPHSRFRLIAYGDGKTYQSREYETLDALLQVFRAAVPDFTEAALCARSDTRHAHIVFSGEMALDESQLSTMGLIDSASKLPRASQPPQRR